MRINYIVFWKLSGYITEVNHIWGIKRLLLGTNPHFHFKNDYSSELMLQQLNLYK